MNSSMNSTMSGTNITSEGIATNDYFEEYDEGEIHFEFITNGILLNLVVPFGVIGNILSMIILSQPHMKSPINYLFICLECGDTLLIITSFFMYGLPAIYRYTKSPIFFYYYYTVYPYTTLFLYPLGLMALTFSVYLTLTVTLERFVAVCLPLRARSLCTYKRARVFVVLICIFSVIYNSSRFFELNLVEELHPEFNVMIYRLVASPLRENEVYINIYTNWMYLLFIYVFPFICLSLFNAAIYRQVRKANSEREMLSGSRKKEIRLATMLICVVIVFVFCNILALVTNVLEAFYGIVLDRMIKLSNLLVTVNSSVNFIIYLIFGEKFRRMFVKLLSCRGWASIRNSTKSDDTVTVCTLDHTL